MFSVAIVGSRTFTDDTLVNRVIDKLHAQHPDLRIVSGGARGADTLAEVEARTRGIPTVVFPADWKGLGRKAGHIRNTTIVENSDLVIALCPDPQITPGTKNTVTQARAASKPVCLYLGGKWHSYRPATA